MAKSSFIDISVKLSSELPTWPEGFGLNISSLSTIDDSNSVNISRLDMDVHCGTHIDAPLHFVKDGRSTDQLDLDRMIGPCFVVEVPSSLVIITAKDLMTLPIPAGTVRLLLKTSNSFNNLWDSKKFDKDFCAISNDAAEWLVENKIDLIGIDYCSIQKFDDDVATHQTLLRNEVIILEGLDLRKVEAGKYNLICLPISVHGIEGAPVRAVLQNNNN
jgi:arylformamidase